MGWDRLGSSGPLLIAFYVFLVSFRHFRLPVIAFMQVEAVAERQAFSRRDREVSGGLIRNVFEIVLAERICRKQTVIPHVPPGRVVRILRMIKHGHTDYFPI